MYSEYDNELFFEKYSQMSRSRYGLEGAGEWYKLKPMFPDVKNKCVLDLGCGFGWHCKYAAQQGAEKILGIDLSSKMIEEAKKRNADHRIEYRLCSIEEYDYPENSWDVAVSNLALHYIDNINNVYNNVHSTLTPDGIFIFNIEHPTFTAGVNQDWIYSKNGKPLYWPVDNYYYPGRRNTMFLGCDVKKYHHTLTQILNGLLENGFEISEIQEAMPAEDTLDIPGMKDEMRRPMMLLVKAVAKK